MISPPAVLAMTRFMRINRKSPWYAVLVLLLKFSNLCTRPLNSSAFTLHLRQVFLSISYARWPKFLSFVKNLEACYPNRELFNTMCGYQHLYITARPIRRVFLKIMIQVATEGIMLRYQITLLLDILVLTRLFSLPVIGAFILVCCIMG